jgi:outer membrane lipoprotein carrier protein
VIQKSSGTFKLDEQYGFNWNVSSPYSEEIIFDKDKLYIHDPDLEQVRIDNIDNNNEFLSIFFNGQDIDDKFESHLLDNNTYVVIPTQNKLGMRHLISFKNQTIDEIIMEDGVAQKTIISFEHSKQNKELEKSDFTFNVYDSLDVIRAYDY